MKEAESLVDDLRRALGDDVVSTEETARLARARDSWPQALAWTPAQLAAHAPLAVLRPQDEDEVRAALAWSARHGVPLVPRGAGSGVLGAAIPGPAAAVLDLSRLSGLFELREAGEPLLRVGAGSLGGALERRLNSQGYSLRHFPQSLEDSSPGGWIAADGWGQLSTRYGGIGRQALAVRAVLPGGTVREEEAEVHIGAEGTLGVLTEATLRVRRLPAARRFFARGFPGAESALAFACAAMNAIPPPSVLRLYSPVDAFFNGLRRKSARSASGGLLQSAEPLLLRHASRLNALAPLAGREWIAVMIYEDEDAFGPGGPPHGGRDLGEGPARRWWERRYHLSKARLEGLFARGCFGDTIDLSAPWDLLAPLERAVRAALRPHALAFSHFSHFGLDGACLYVTFAGSGDSHAAAWDAAVGAAADLGAGVNHHHGVGLAKLPWLTRAKDAVWLSRWQAEKRARDPHGLLNPGKLCQ